ncbi:hypothetical protein [Nonomuraea polychroma]|nr:hypothetical protein [Nonomuraea polychroma]
MSHIRSRPAWLRRSSFARPDSGKAPAPAQHLAVRAPARTITWQE